jgi:hypothetical protein
MDEMDYITIEENQPFGDPSLAIAEDAQNQPPNVPTVNGETSGTVNEEYIYSASTTDPDEDQLFYIFDWGDGELSDWIGPLDSGDTAEAGYIWTEKGNYEIRVKAKDEYGAQSDWSDPLVVTMPRGKITFSNTFIKHIFEQFLNLFPMLRYIF